PYLPSGSYTIPGTGITIEFPATAPTAGDTFAWTALPPFVVNTFSELSPMWWGARNDGTGDATGALISWALCLGFPSSVAVTTPLRGGYTSRSGSAPPGQYIISDTIPFYNMLYQSVRLDGVTLRWKGNYDATGNA